MPGTFQVGQLVEIFGLDSPVDVPVAWRKPGKPYVGAKDVNGVRGQVVKWYEDKGHWMVATFDADMVPLEEQYLRPLSIADLDGYDMVLGPRSDPAIMGEHITTSIVEKGIAVCKLFVAPDDLAGMVDTAERAVADSNFVRLPLELEPGYLGKEGTGKTMSLDMEDEDLEDYIRDSALRVIEDTFSSVGTILRPFTEDKLGHGIHSRSNTMMVLPFDGAADAEQFPPPDFENEEAAQFLQTMYRAKLMVMVNAGPASGTLTLFSSIEGVGEKRFTIEPGSLVLLSTEWKYAFASAGKSLTGRCWYLDQPHSFEIRQHPDADLEALVDIAPSSASPPPRGDPVAVVAMATRYAFGVDSAEKLWMQYRHAGFDTFCEFPSARFSAAEFYEQNADAYSGKAYTRHGGFSDGIELFDNKFFDISPAEAGGMDPTQRQVMEVSYMSLAGGGFHKKDLMKKPEQIAVFVGIDKNEWIGMPRELGSFSGTSSANAITSNRFSYSLNLKGASMTIDTACSASLVCTHTAKLYLLHKQWDPCRASITCGVNLLLSANTFVGACAAGMLSHNGRSFTYNASADGYGRGESTASHCIKNESWDNKDKGHLCMMAGSQVNQDGRSASLTAPNGPSQEKCTAAVMRECGLTPPEIDATECHGTGTSLGDPIELGAYQKVLCTVPRDDPVCITTNKASIGHCEGSAGIAGFLKICIMSMHSECTPNCHFNCLNPHIDMTGFPAVILTEGIAYKEDTSYNTCLSFGFGGTNACAAVWGINYLTTRAAGSKNVFRTLVDKIQKAPPQEVTITGENWEDWEMDGPGKNVKLDQAWDIAIMPDGTIQYLERPEELKDLGSFYFLTSTVNGWTYEAMEQDDMLEGVYSTTIQIGPRGEEHFQIVADEDEDMVFYPALSNCHWKSAEVKGPEKTSNDKAWCITGYPGEVHRIEFCKSRNDKVSVMWFKET